MQLVFFRLHLMLHARIARFDVMGTVALFKNLGLELNTASIYFSSMKGLQGQGHADLQQGRPPLATRHFFFKPA